MPVNTTTLVGAAEKTAGTLLSTVQSNIGNTSTKLTSLAAPRQVASLAPSLFSSGPSDKLVTRDIYGVVDGNPINHIDRLLGNNSNLISAFQARTGKIGGLSSLLSRVGSGISLNPAALSERVQGALTGFSGTYRTLSPDMLGRATQATGLSLNQFPNVTTTVGGVVSTVRTTNLGGAQDLIATVNAITGDPSLASYMDVGASSALMSVVMRDAITMGLHGTVETLVAHATNSEVAANALRANTAYAVQVGDIGTVKTITNALGSGYVSSQVPRASGQLLSSYRFPAGTDASQYPDLYNDLHDTLTAVEPGWGSAQRNGASVSDLTPFANMSEDARTLFQSQGAYSTEMAIASSYPNTGLIDQAKTQYPYMLVTPANNEYVVTNPSTRGV